MVLDGVKHFQQPTKLDVKPGPESRLLFDDGWWLCFDFFLPHQATPHTLHSHSGIGAAPDSKNCAQSFETVSSVSQFTLWYGGGGWVFPLLWSSSV